MMEDDNVFFKDIEEDKNGYFITYRSISTESKFALLKITFYERITIEEAIAVVEKEFQEYIEKYPLPLMAKPVNETKTPLDFKRHTGCSFIVGFPRMDRSTYFRWKSIPEEEYFHFDLSRNNLLKIYSNIPFKTSEDNRKNINLLITTRKIQIIIMLLWFSIIPALIAFFGWANPFVSFLALG